MTETQQKDLRMAVNQHEDARILINIGKFEEALSILENILLTRRSQKQTCNLDIATTYIDKGNVHHFLGNHKQALSDLNCAVEYLVEVFGPTNKLVCKVTSSIKSIEAASFAADPYIRGAPAA